MLTMIVASFLHKLSPYYSLGRWLVSSGLHRYLPPSDKQLRPLVPTPAQANKTSKKKALSQRDKVLSSKKKSTPEEIAAALNYDPNSLDKNLSVPKSANLKLVTAPLNWEGDVDLLHFSSELEFMVNLTLAALAVFAMTSVYFHLRPAARVEEYNLSIIWLAVVIGYTFKVLFTLTRIYLSEELAHQRSLLVVFTTLFFVCALGILLVDESILNFGLDTSHQNISQSVSIILGAFLRNGKNIKVIPMWGLKIFLALLSNALSMLLIFPGFRFADTHFSTIYHSRSPFFKMFLHANYIAPMFSLSLWIRPLTQDMVAGVSTVNVLGVTEMSYNTFRVVVLLGVCLLRMALFRAYLQSYLDTARWRVENLRHEQGRITIQQLRNKVSNIFLFYAALGVQYIAPYILLLCFSLLLLASSANTVEGVESDLEKNTVNIFRLSGFGIGIFHGCVAFVCWWVCFANAITSGFGAILKEFIT